MHGGETDAYRWLVLIAMAVIVHSDPLKIFAAHEVGGVCDGSMATKMTVQFNLFGGTVFKLGNGRAGDTTCIR